MRKQITAFVLALILALTMTAAASASSMDAQRLDTYYSLAINAINTENYDKALSYLDSALQYCSETDSPEMYADIHLKKGCVYTIRGDYDNAHQELDEAIRVIPDLSDAYLVKVQAYTEAGDDVKAAETLEKYIEVSGETGYYQTLAEMYAKNGDSENALRAYQAFLDANQLEGAAGLFSMANYKLDSGMYQEAIADYEACLEDPDYGKSASYNIGICRLQMEDYENALPAFEACTDSAADFNGVWYNIGICNMMLERIPEAIEAFGHSIDTETYKTDALYNRAICCFSLEQYQQAADDLTRYMELVEEAAKTAEDAGTEPAETVADIVVYYRGVCYLALGENEKAVEDFTECIERGYEVNDNTYNRGLACLQGGQFDQAKKDFTTCIEKGTNANESFYYRSFANLYLEDYDGALADLNVLIARDYELSRVYYQRAQVYQAMGNNIRYLEDLETSLQY